MKHLVLSAICVLFYTLGTAQELNPTVRITTPKLQTADPQIFKTMETSIVEFLNNTRWTEDEFEPDERIEVNFQINITQEINDNTFLADIALQSLRPVFGSDYKTALITHVDKDVLITYEEFQPILDSRDIFKDNLSSLLTFYAYLVLGYDYDTFEDMGGDPYFRIAQSIINTIPPGISGQDKGWSSLGGNKTNRYWIMENMLSPRIRPYRTAMYKYHRIGLDMMESNTEKGLASMTEAISDIDQVRNSYPNSMTLRMFSNAKSDEIIDVFRAADRTAKSKVMQVMRKIDVANANKYNVLRS